MKRLRRDSAIRPRRRGSTLILAAVFAAPTLVPATPASAYVAMAWGSNEQGQLGNGSVTSSDVPVAVTGLSGVSAVSAGAEHSLATIENAKVMAWGDNLFGQLGNYTKTSSAVPVQVLSGVGFVHAIAAGGQHSMAFTTEGITRTVYGWGNDEEGQVGDKNTASPHLYPERIFALGAREVSNVAAGGEHSLAVTKYGTVYAFGTNTSGQLGIGSEVEEDLPVIVPGLSGVTAVAAGPDYSLARLSNGTVVAWGSNTHGKLGIGTAATNSLTPVAVCAVGHVGPCPALGEQLQGVLAIAAGGDHSLALLGNGTVVAWGDNEEGQLGNGSTEDSLVPVPVSGVGGVGGLGGVSSIAAGAEHSLALLGSGHLVAWGTNDDGQLGDGEEEEESSNVPVEVSGLGGVAGITAGERYSLAFGAPPPPPAVGSISPHEGPPTGGTSVKITGTNLNLATAVYFGSASATRFTVDSTTAITAVAPTGSGVVDVTVGNAGGWSATSPSDRFSYLPVVTAVSPSQGLPSGGSEVAITGTKFTGASTVTFGSTGALNFAVNSDNSITALVPPGVGVVDVTVTTPGGTSAAGPADRFSYVPFLPPAVTGVSPSEGPAQGGTSVTITGKGFVGATGVEFGSTNATAFAVNPEGTSITAVSPSGAGAVDVTVTVPGATSATSPADHFTYQAPSVSGVSPSEGPAQGGTAVTITGKGFAGASAVDFGSTNATAFAVNPEGTSITAVSPVGFGTVDVTVSTPGGRSVTSPADQFSYRLAPPTVTGVEPNQGHTLTPTQVTITGTDFFHVTAVDFAGWAAESFTAVSETTILAVAPAEGRLIFCSPTRGYVTVTTPGGTSATGPANEFEYGCGL